MVAPFIVRSSFECLVFNTLHFPGAAVSILFWVDLVKSSKNIFDAQSIEAIAAFILANDIHT